LGFLQGAGLAFSLIASGALLLVLDTIALWRRLFGVAGVALWDSLLRHGGST
jgi:hypothetical protein